MAYLKTNFQNYIKKISKTNHQTSKPKIKIFWNKFFFLLIHRRYLDTDIPCCEGLQYHCAHLLQFHHIRHLYFYANHRRCARLHTGRGCFFLLYDIVLIRHLSSSFGWLTGNGFAEDHIRSYIYGLCQFARLVLSADAWGGHSYDISR